MNLYRPSSQRGVALAVALVLLVVIALLGLAAVRYSQTALRLAGNQESRLTAVQSAQSLVSLTLEGGTTYLPANEDPTWLACFPLTLPALATGLSCPSTRSAQIVSSAANDGDGAGFGYVIARRELPLFTETGTVRQAENSARAYDFVRYSIIAGYDRQASGQGAAEIREGRLVPHVKPSQLGVTSQ